MDRGLPRPEEFIEIAAPAIAGKMPEGWVHNHMDSGNTFLLVDGVDEIPQDRRSEMRAWLEELAGAYPQTRIIVTSRPAAIHEGWMDSQGFESSDVEPMDLADIDSFVSHWHNAVAAELQRQEEIDDVASLATALKEVLRRNRSMRSLATNPLLCAVICALHRDRRQQLPTDRIELYEACCHMLFERRDVERQLHIESDDYPRLSYREKRSILEHVSYWMMRNSLALTHARNIDERIDAKLTNMPNIAASVSGMDVRRLFVDRSGMIREPIADHIDFTHRTFQEFLAAKAVLDEGDVGLLVDRAEDDQWQGLIILAAGLASARGREQLISRLIARGDEESRHRHQLHLLAVACLETSIELSPEL